MPTTRVYHLDSSKDYFEKMDEYHQILSPITVDQGYNKYMNRFKSLSNHKIAMHYGKTRYQRMILYHQNVSESLQTHQNASEALKLDK